LCIVGTEGRLSVNTLQTKCEKTVDKNGIACYNAIRVIPKYFIDKEKIMKKSGILSLVAVFLMLAMMLTACGGTVSMKKVFNEDYKVVADPFTGYTELEEIEDYEIEEYNQEVIVLQKAEEDSVTYKFLNLRTGEIVKTIEAKDELYLFQLVDNLPLVFVAKVAEEEAAEPAPAAEESEGGKLPENPFADIDAEFYLYDITGEEVATSDYCYQAPVAFADLVIYDDVAYDIDADGALVNPTAVPEYVIKNENAVVAGDFFVVPTAINSERPNCFYVYDRTFHYVSSFFAPGYASVNLIAPLEDGNVLVQYAVKLDENAKKYDYYDFGFEGITEKYDLQTYVFNSVKGTLKSVKMDYLLTAVVPNSDLYDAEAENNLYTDKFDNIAVGYAIEDKRINDSQDGIDMFLLSNKGKVGKSLKFFDTQKISTKGILSFKKLSSDMYLVQGLNGVGILDKNGKLINMIANDTLEFTGEYFVGEKAIYDLDFEIVYHFAENKGDAEGTVGGAVIIEEETDEGFDAILLHNGEETVIYSSDDEKVLDYDVAPAIGCYVLETEDGYEYYNVEGELVIETKTSLEFMPFATKGGVFGGEETEDGYTYYFFTK